MIDLPDIILESDEANVDNLGDEFFDSSA